MTLSLLAIPGVPLLVAALTALRGGQARSIVALCLAGSLTALTLSLATLPSILAGEVVSVSLPWAPSIGLSLGFFVDGLSLLFLVLIAGIGALVVLYASYYLHEDEAHARFYASLMLFMASMLGVVSAGNLLLLVVFWELTSVSSFLLIGFWDEKADSRAGAYQSLIVTGLGGLSLLAGVLVVGLAIGSFELSDWLRRADEIRSLPTSTVALVLILGGAFTKSAQFPFHFWLPSAMAAPTPVSAYLHSATMVKAGLFLLARLSPVFAETALWYGAVTGIGAVTMMVGGWVALRHTDLKRILAYSTVSQLGLVTMLLGIGTKAAAIAAMFHILNHAAFKGALFMSAGIVDHEAGTRDIARLGGLRRAMPRTTVLVAVAAAAMAGIPPLNGFLSKEMFFEASLHAPSGAWLLAGLAVAGSVLTAAYCLRLVHGAFFGPEGSPPGHPHEPPAGFRLPVEIFVAACVAVGLFPGTFAAPIVDAAASSVLAETAHSHIVLWHGFTFPLLMSAVAIGGGIVLHASRLGVLRVPLPPWTGRSADERYDAVIRGLLDGSRRLTDAIQNGSLRRYVTVTLGVALALAGTSLFREVPGGRTVEAVAAPGGAELVTLLTIVGCFAAAVFHPLRWPSVLLVGAVGMLVAIFFSWLSAPDLVLTQILVESVTTILLVLVLHFLPKHADREPPRRLAVDGTFALVVGAAAASVIYAILLRPFETISEYHVANSLEQAGGGNVVNVILVDFRGYDTMGEITVLAIAAIGVVALVRAGRSTA